MSVSVTRLIEIYKPCVDELYWDETELDNDENIYDGKVCKIQSDTEYPYRVFKYDDELTYDPEGEEPYQVGHWEKQKTCEYKWELVKYWVNNDSNLFDKAEHRNDIKEPLKIFNRAIHLKEIHDFTLNSPDLRDNYFSNWYNSYNLTKRGVPSDVSDECKQHLHINDNSYCWGHTYVMLSEWYEIYEKELESLKNKLKTSLINSDMKTMSEKIDKIYNKVFNIPELNNSTSDDEYVYTYGDAFDDNIYKVISVNDEIAKISYIVREIYGYSILDKDIRINYYFS